VPGSGGGVFRLDHSYNAADQPATLRYPGGTVGEQGELVTTGFDALGQVNSVSGSGVSYVSSTTYNARGQVVEQRLDTGSNGLTRQYVYDAKAPCAPDHAAGRRVQPVHQPAKPHVHLRRRGQHRQSWWTA
jgi:hypothetical protein